MIGNVHQVGTSPFVDHSNIAKKLGDIHSVSMFGHTIVVLSSLEAMKLCNFSSSDVFSHRPTWLQNVVRCGAPGIVFKGAVDYHDNRRFLLTNLKSRGMGRSGLEGQLLEEVERLITHLTTNKELDPKILLTNFTSNTIMTMCFEKRWEYGDENYTRFADSIEKIVETFPLVMLRDLVPLFGYLPSVAQGNRENYEANVVLRSQFEELIRERVHSEDSPQWCLDVDEKKNMHELLIVPNYVNYNIF